MNRRGFFGALLALPAALKAVAMAKPSYVYEWKDLPAPAYDWKNLHAPIAYTADKVEIPSETFTYMGKPMKWSRHVPEGRVYFVNREVLETDSWRR